MATENKIHLHIGLGNLGLGLVLPFLKAQIPLLIAQRITGKWQKKGTTAAKTLKLDNGIGFARHVRVITLGDQTVAEIDEHLNACDVSPLILFYDEAAGLDAFTRLVPRLSSVSLSVASGQPAVGKWLRSFESPLYVFPFENNIDLICPRHTVIRVVPDRICFGQKWSATAVTVQAERFAEVVFEGPKNICETYFDLGGAVKSACIDSARIYDYFHRRKRRLVNSLHYVCAILAYDALQKKDVPSAEWNSQYLPISLPGLLSEQSETRRLIEAFISAQAMRCVLETKWEGLLKEDREQLPFANDDEQHYFYLHDYGMQSLNRFSGPTDKLSRIHDLANSAKSGEKYDEFLDGLMRFVIRHWNTISKFPGSERAWEQDVLYAINRIQNAEHGYLAARAAQTRKQ